VAEIWHLKVRDIHIAERLLHVHAKPEVGWTPKTHTEREVPIDAIAEWLAQHVKGRAPDAWLFERKPGHRWTHATYFPLQRALFRSLGLQARGAHGLRHGLATHLLREGASLVDVQHILGHASPTTTLRYLHSDAASQRRALSVLTAEEGDR
jgi:integrase/recombinase XerD